MEEDATMEPVTALLDLKENIANKRLVSMIVQVMVCAKITPVYVRKITLESTAP